MRAILYVDSKSKRRTAAITTTKAFNVLHAVTYRYTYVAARLTSALLMADSGTDMCATKLKAENKTHFKFDLMKFETTIFEFFLIFFCGSLLLQRFACAQARLRKCVLVKFNECNTKR